MTQSNPPLPLEMILCTRSERRVYLLREAGFRFGVIVSNFHEAGVSFSNPIATGKAVARGKIEAVAARLPAELVAVGETDPTSIAPDVTLVGADTMVELNGVLYGQPTDPGDARRILRELSGQTHKVYTSVAILRMQPAAAAGSVAAAPARPHSHIHMFTGITEVTFRVLTDFEIDGYIETGEPLDKAGAYGIQGHGRSLVRGWKGSLYNVIGFPLEEFLAHEACPLAARLEGSKMPSVRFPDNVIAGL